MDQSWCTIESDPGVFSELIEKFGIKGLQVEEIYSLDPTEQKLESSYGLVFLFKWRNEVDHRQVIDSEDIPELFFARQVITNACATQAILSVLLNAEGIQLGETLSNFKAFASEFDAESKGLAISNSDVIRLAHNSFARPDYFFMEESQRVATEKDDVYHFIAYLPHGGAVYELDGLKNGPIRLGNIGNNSWWSVAKPALEERMQRYSESETRFSLLTICKKVSLELDRAILDRMVDIDTINYAVEHIAPEVVYLSSGQIPGHDTVSLLQERQKLEQEVSVLRNELAFELHKQEKQREENARRKHNYLPFIVELLRKLAAKDLLRSLVTRAEERKANNGNRDGSKQI